MSSDNGIKLIQLDDGKWVGIHYMASSEATTEELINVIKSGGARYPRYSSLEDVTQAYRGAAAETEYGFEIIWNKDTLGRLTDPQAPDEESSFGQELTKLINKHSLENQTGTPDFILARFLERQLWIFKETIEQRASYRGFTLDRFGTEVPKKANEIPIRKVDPGW